MNPLKYSFLFFLALFLHFITFSRSQSFDLEILTNETTDATLTPLPLRELANSSSSNEFLHDVIDATIFKIRQSNIFRDTITFVINRMASGEIQQCLFGETDFTSLYLCDGILQLESSQFETTKDVFWHEELREKHQAISNYAGWGTQTPITWSEVTMSDMKKPLYAAIAMHLLATAIKVDGGYIGSYTGWAKLRPNISSRIGLRITMGTPATFHTNLDVIFVVDAAATIDDALELNMASSLIAIMELTAVDTRVGIVAYDETAHIIIPLMNISFPCNRRSFRSSKIMSNLGHRIQEYAQQRKNRTSTITVSNSSMADGLEAAIKMLRINKLPGRNAKSVIYIVAKGDTEHSHYDTNSTMRAAADARESGISILAVLAQDKNDKQGVVTKLADLVGGENHHLMIIKRGLGQFTTRTDMMKDLSQVPVQLFYKGEESETGNTGKRICFGRLSQNEKEYYKYNFGTMTNTNDESSASLLVNFTLLIEQSVFVSSRLSGTTPKELKGYYSYNFPIPSAAVHDGIIDASTQVKIPIENFRNSTFVYVSIIARELDEDDILAYSLAFEKFSEDGESSEMAIFLFSLKFLLYFLVFVVGVLAVIFIVRRFQAAKITRTRNTGSIAADDSISYSVVSSDIATEFQRL